MSENPVEAAANELFEDFWGEPPGKGNSARIVRRTCEVIESHCHVTEITAERDRAVEACKKILDFLSGAHLDEPIKRPTVILAGDEQRSSQTSDTILRIIQAIARQAVSE